MSGVSFVFGVLALMSAALSLQGWVHGDWWGALGVVLAMTFSLITAATTLHASPRNRIQPEVRRG